MLPLLAQEPSATLERARQVNLERAAALPNFVVDEYVQRYKSGHSDPPKWKLFDTIESELAVQGSGFTRQQVRRDGKPWKKPDLSDFNWGNPFGYGIPSLFGAGCPTTFEFEKGENASGKEVLVYRYQSPPNGCFGNLNIRSWFSNKTYNPARFGRIWIDLPAGNVVQFIEEIREYPKDFGADPWTQIITLDYVKIGEVSHLAPVSAEIYGGFQRGDLWHVLVEYKNHRRFEASTSIRFEEPGGR
jgi:hypothetical protein